MAVVCANCGEDLLGAVNRCWRCGQHVLSAPGSGEAPPVRQEPPEGFVRGVEVIPAQMIPPMGGADLNAGSPPQRLPTPQDGERLQRILRVVAIASIVFGALSLLLMRFTFAALGIASIGIAAGIVGFRSRWHQMAAVGLLLSLMALFGSSAWLAYAIFTAWYGQSPLGPPAPNVDSQLPDSLE